MENNYNKNITKPKNKKEWIIPQVEIISGTTIEGGTHHNATEAMGSFKVPGHPSQTTNGYS